MIHQLRDCLSGGWEARLNGGGGEPLRPRPRRVPLLFAVLILTQLSFPSEPIVRIGIERNVTGFTLSSPDPFTVDGVEAREAAFSTFVGVIACAFPPSFGR